MRFSRMRCKRRQGQSGKWLQIFWKVHTRNFFFFFCLALETGTSHMNCDCLLDTNASNYIVSEGLCPTVYLLMSYPHSLKEKCMWRKQWEVSLSAGLMFTSFLFSSLCLVTRTRMCYPWNTTQTGWMMLCYAVEEEHVSSNAVKQQLSGLFLEKSCEIDSAMF